MGTPCSSAELTRTSHPLEVMWLLNPEKIPISKETTDLLERIGRALKRHRRDDLREHDAKKFAEERLWGRGKRWLTNLEGGQMSRLAIGEFLEVVKRYRLVLDELISLVLEGVPKTVYLPRPDDAVEQGSAEPLTWGTPHGPQLRYVNYLSDDLRHFNVSVSAATLRGGRSTEGLVPAAHLGEEVLIVTEGEIEVRVADETRTLRPGDMLVFKSRHPHFARDCTGGVSRYIVVRTRCRQIFPGTDRGDSGNETHE